MFGVFDNTLPHILVWDSPGCGDDSGTVTDDVILNQIVYLLKNSGTSGVKAFFFALKPDDRFCYVKFCTF